MNSALILAAQTLGAAMIAGYFSWRIAMASQRANEKTTDVQKDANAVAGFHQLVEDLQTDIDRLRGDVETLRGELTRTNLHVRSLEQERVRDKSLIRHLVSYIHTLKAALRAARVPIPEAPAGLDLEGGPLT